MLRWMNICIHAYGRKSNKQSKEWSKNVRSGWTLAELCVTSDLWQDQPQQRLPPMRETYGLNLLANPPDEDILIYHRSENFINSLAFTVTDSSVHATGSEKFILHYILKDWLNCQSIMRNNNNCNNKYKYFIKS